jgi:hypothetical protein
VDDGIRTRARACFRVARYQDERQTKARVSHRRGTRHVSCPSGLCRIVPGSPASLVAPGSRVTRGIRRGGVFQERGLVCNMNALANVALPLRYHAGVFGITRHLPGTGP